MTKAPAQPVDSSRPFFSRVWNHAILLLFFPALLSVAETIEAPPPALESYKGRVIARTMHWEGAGWLLRKEREREEATRLMISRLGLQAGQTVCDLGSGNGYHSLMMARLVGETGRVLAVDIQPEMLSMLRKRAEEQHLHNVETIVGALHDPRLPAEALDLVLAVDAYHEFSHPEHMLQAVHRSLKPGGRLVLVEFRLEDPAIPIKPLHKMSRKQILKELEPNGFRLVEEYNGLPWQHMMFFERAALKTGE